MEVPDFSFHLRVSSNGRVARAIKSAAQLVFGQRRAGPYLWIDASYVKSRQAGRVVSVAEIVAGASGPSEAEPFWTDFLRGLTRRGLRGVKLVISDLKLPAVRGV